MLVILTVIGVLAVFVFGFGVGSTQHGKWARAEIVTASVAALVLIPGVLWWADASQGACLESKESNTYGLQPVCRDIVTMQHVAITYVVYAAGLSLGIGWRCLPK